MLNILTCLCTKSYLFYSSSWFQLYSLHGQNCCILPVVAMPGYGFSKRRTTDATGADVIQVTGTPCPLNFYNAGRNQLPCRSCPSVLITITKPDGAGGSSLRDCIAPPGYAFDRGSAKPCPRGSYKTAASNANSCTRCPVGLTTESTASTSLDDCYQASPGYYVEVPAVSGKLCPRGTYNPGYNNATECTACERNMVTVNPGSTSSSSCLAPPGWGYSTELPAGSRVNACEIGFYKGGFNLKPCSYCGDGLRTKTTGSASKQECMIPPGWGTKAVGDGTDGRTMLILEQCLNGTYGLAVPTFGVQSLPCKPCGDNMRTMDAKPDWSGNLTTFINAGFDSCVTLPGYGWVSMGWLWFTCMIRSPC